MPSSSLIAVLRMEGLTDQQARGLVEQADPIALRAQADLLADRVPPVTAGPLTNHDRRYRDAAAELRQLACHFESEAQ